MDKWLYHVPRKELQIILIMLAYANDTKIAG